MKNIKKNISFYNNAKREYCVWGTFQSTGVNIYTVSSNFKFNLRSLEDLYLHGVYVVI